jgi:hypothetical protein
MMRMLADANAKLATVGEKPATDARVTCYTCHRGQTKPLTAPPPAGG